MNGVKAVERENDYLMRMEAIDREHAMDDPKWANPKASICLIPIFSIMDGMVLFSIFDACLTQNAFMGIIMSFGIAVVLNLLPLIIAKFLHQTIYKLKKEALSMLIITLTGFILIFAGTVILRFAYSDMYESENQSVQLENTVSNEINIEEESDDSDNNKSLAVVLLLSITPLITSLIGFSIEYISNDEIRTRVRYHERRDIELDEAISDLEAAVETMNSDVVRDLELDEQSMNAVIEVIISKEATLKALARHYLAEYLADTVATSKLSEEMLVIRNDMEKIDEKEVVFQEIKQIRDEYIA